MPLRRFAALLAACLAAAWLVACGGGGSDAEGREVAFTTVAQSSQSGITVRETAVVRSAAEFTALWARHGAAQTPAPAEPAIDFSRLQVLAYFMGQQPSGCHGVTITRVTQTTDRLQVVYREQQPTAGMACTLAIVHPAHLVTVPASALPVEFVAE